MNKKKISSKTFLYQILIFIVSVLIIVFIMPKDRKFNYQFSLNSPWKYGQLIATFDFPIYKSEAQLQQEEDSLLRSFKPYFDYTSSIGQTKVDQFKQIFGHDTLLPANRYRRFISVLENIYSQGLITGEENTWMQEEQYPVLMSVENNVAYPVSLDKLYTEKAAYELLTRNDTSALLRKFLSLHDLTVFLEPNLKYNEARSESAKQELLSTISKSNGLVQSGQKIVDRGDLVDERTAQILESMRIEWNERLSDSDQIELVLIGQFLYVSLLVLLLFAYLNLYRRDYFEHKRELLLLFVSVVISIVIVGLMMKFIIGNVFMLPLTMLPMILRVFMDSRTAFIGFAITILISSIMLNYPYEFMLLQLAAGMTAIYSLRELSQRSQLFRSALFVFFSYALLYFAYELIQENDMQKLNPYMYIYFFINGVLLLFTYPLMYIIEKTFGFTSNVTLVELSNINHPLLHKLSETAPGTFQHSMQVSNLAAEAAHRIGAHSQLVRTGALYHDVGKIKNPHYFIENQQSGVNLHEKLNYMESAEIIIRHVIDGVKLAEKYHLPQVIKELIASHHGKGKANYFYISYKNEHPGEIFDESAFSYPGPNPTTREMAILMMADAVEAASKSLKEYTEENIGEMVNRIIDGQVKEGFFTECPITFKDIVAIKTVFKERLKTIYHTRINYPEEKGQATGAVPEKPSQKAL